MTHQEDSAAAQPAYALECHGVRKLFPGVVALEGVDLGVRRAEIHALVGQNGAGKSTLLKLLSRITEPSAGRIRLRGTVDRKSVV